MNDETYYKALENETKIEILQDEIKKLQGEVDEMKDRIYSLESDMENIWEIMYYKQRYK